LVVIQNSVHSLQEHMISQQLRYAECAVYNIR